MVLVVVGIAFVAGVTAVVVYCNRRLQQTSGLCFLWPLLLSAPPWPRPSPKHCRNLGLWVRESSRLDVALCFISSFMFVHSFNKA